MSARNRFVKRLEHGPVIVADGGVGALLTSAVSRLRCPEEANLRAPEAVTSLHVSFIQAGAELIETNTFGANRRKLAQHYLEDDFERINSSAIRLAREAREVAGREVFVAGAIGPLGDGAEIAAEERSELFAEQATILEGRGADLFMVETFFDLGELVAAIEGVRSVSSLPVVALLSFDEEGETLSGVSAADAARRLADMDVAAVGANHGAGVQAALRALEQMTPAAKPLAALPNIGLASLVGSRVVYPHAAPDYFGEFAAHATRLGARIVGGCCGTTPVEIAAVATAIADERQPRAAISSVADSTHVFRPNVVEDATESRLEQMLKAGEWVVSVQLDPPLGGSSEGVLASVRTLADSGLADFVDINDNPMGSRARMNSLMLAVEIERQTGIETIPHVTPRDTTILGLQSAVLGAHAAGVRNVLAVTGDPPEGGDYPGAQGVYEVDSIGLTHVLAQLNRGEDFHGRAINAPTSFFPGVAVNPAADDLELELDRFRQKIDAGARFAMTQILFDLAYLDRFLERLGGDSPIPLLVGLWPLRSHQLALRLHNEVPGIVVPEAVQQALLRAGSDAPRVGLEIACALREEARDRVAGYYAVAPFRQPLGILDFLEE